MKFLLLLAAIISISLADNKLDYQDYEVIYSWVSVDYDWLNETMKSEYLQNGEFVPKWNAPTGIKVYGGEVYVTISRWFSGVPATLNKVVKKPNGEAVLKPFPSWENHTIGDCNDLQWIQSMEIDPNTGYMWIADTGRTGIFGDPQFIQNSCPAKMVIYDLKMDKEIRRYTFPNDVVSRTTNYLNDIVLDYVEGEAAYAYLSDSGFPGLVVYDFKNDNSYRFEDPKMSYEPNTPIHIDGGLFDPKIPINGIGMSADFKYVYFSAISGVSLYQIPTSALRSNASDISNFIRKVGTKPSQGDGMVFSKESLYFGGLNDSSVYRWKLSEDVKKNPMVTEGNVVLSSVEIVLRNVTNLKWPDTFAIDEAGFLWFTSPNAAKLFKNELDLSENAYPNFFVIKTHIKEKSYLSGALYQTTSNSHHLVPQTVSIMSSGILLIFICKFLH